jgi:hypothetical protein
LRAAAAALYRPFARGITRIQHHKREVTMRRVQPVFAVLLLFAAPLAAQDHPAPAARAEDVASIDAILAALYDVISGPAGQKRDWDRFHALFVPGARLIPTGRTPQGEVRHRVITPQEYASMSGPALEERGFFEREIGRTMERFGNVAHVFSAYDSRRAQSDAQPFARGINSIQLLHDGSRWWVVSIFWDSERADNPIPPQYLKSGG